MPHDPKHTAIDKLISEVLDGTHLQLTLDRYTVTEDTESGVVKIECDTHDQRTGEKHLFSGEGVGLIDAFFAALVERYAIDYPSIKTIRFADFSIKAKRDSGKSGSKSDMLAEAILWVENSADLDYHFSHDSASVTRASLNVALDAAEFFINSERAYIEVYRALQHAKSNGRPDSVAHYTRQLTTLVEATSYSEVIEQLKNQDI